MEEDESEEQHGSSGSVAERMAPDDRRELTGRKNEFQEILRLLVEFDERTGRYRRATQPELHLMRKALVAAEAKDLKIFVRALGGFVYHVTVSLQVQSGRLTTSWVHEDGIRSERDVFREEGAHPVHNIVCLTDLYQTDAVTVPAEQIGDWILKEDDELLELTGRTTAQQES